MDFQRFIESKMRNAWIVEPGIEIYVRISLPSRGTDYDLATAVAASTGRGALTRFLDTWEPRYSFYIENVLDPDRLGKFFLNRGYKEINQQFDVKTCCYSNGKIIE